MEIGCVTTQRLLTHSHNQDFFEINNTPDTTHLTQWETHKCIVRGTFIKLAATRKRARQEYIDTLLRQIQTLEWTHKLTKAQTTQKELEQAREHLQE